jgi:hypothetical protein
MPPRVSAQVGAQSHLAEIDDNIAMVGQKLVSAKSQIQRLNRQRIYAATQFRYVQLAAAARKLAALTLQLRWGVVLIVATVFGGLTVIVTSSAVLTVLVTLAMAAIGLSLMYFPDDSVVTSAAQQLCLAEVFTEPGYEVQHVGGTGDQGADLIITLCGRRIVIQVKGREGTVGNGAVQEAHAAKSFYCCHACCVITNSKFSPSAEILAKSVGCTLIDEDRLPDLVMGSFNLFGQQG